MSRKGGFSDSVHLCFNSEVKTKNNLFADAWFKILILCTQMCRQYKDNCYKKLDLMEKHTSPNPRARHFISQLCEGGVLQRRLQWRVLRTLFIRSQVVLLIHWQIGKVGSAGKLLWWEHSYRGAQAYGTVGLRRLPLCAAVGWGVDWGGEEQDIGLLGNWRWNLGKSQPEIKDNSETNISMMKSFVRSVVFTLGFFLSDSSARQEMVILEGSVLLLSCSSGASSLLQGEGSEPPSPGPRWTSGSVSMSGSIAGSSRRGWGSGRGGRSKRDCEWWRKGLSQAVCVVRVWSGRTLGLVEVCGGGFLGLGFFMTL